MEIFYRVCHSEMKTTQIKSEQTKKQTNKRKETTTLMIQSENAL